MEENHLFNKHISIYCVPGIVLGPGDTGGKKEAKIPVSWGPVYDKQNKQIKYKSCPVGTTEEKIKARNRRNGDFSVFRITWWVRMGLAENGAFEHRAEGVRESQWGKGAPGRGHSQSKGPEAGARQVWKEEQRPGVGGGDK